MAPVAWQRSASPRSPLALCSFTLSLFLLRVLAPRPHRRVPLVPLAPPVRRHLLSFLPAALRVALSNGWVLADVIRFNERKGKAVGRFVGRKRRRWTWRVARERATLLKRAIASVRPESLFVSLCTSGPIATTNHRTSVRFCRFRRVHDVCSFDAGTVERRERSFGPVDLVV